MGTVSVISYVPVRNGIPYDKLQLALEALVPLTQPYEVGTVDFKRGNENKEGINALWIKTSLDKSTKDLLQDALGYIFDAEFEVSCSGDILGLNLGPRINKKAIELKRELFT